MLRLRLIVPADRTDEVAELIDLTMLIQKWVWQRQRERAATISQR